MRKLVLLGLLAIPAMAVAASATEPAPKAQGDENSDRVVCRAVKETGSRLSRRRVCLTPEQWVEQRRETRNNIDRAQTQRVERSY